MIQSNIMSDTVSPRHYAGVMISSTFADLKRHREVLIKVIDGHELKPVAMEFDSAIPYGC